MTTMDNVAAQLESLKMQLGDLESSLRVNSAFQNSQQLITTSNVPVLTTAHQNSLGMTITALGLGALAAKTWAAANEYVFVPVIVASPMRTRAPQCFPGTVAGSYETGLYTASGQLLISQTGAAAGTPISIGQGLYYMAMWSNSATDTFYGWSAPNAVTALNIGVDWQGTASSLPISRPPDSTNTLFTMIPMLAIGAYLWTGV